MPEHIERSRMEELEGTVKNLSQKVETLWSENIILNEKSKKSDAWVAQLISCCKEMVKHIHALEEKSSALTQELELQNLYLNALSMSTGVEEKSLNNDSIIGEMHQIQEPHIFELPNPTMDEFDAVIDELGLVLEGAPQLRPEHLDFPSYSMNSQLEPIATIPTSRKRKAQEMAESGPGTPLPPSSSYSAPITFLNTFSDEVPAKRATRNPARKAGRPKAGMPLTPPPEEPPQEQLVQEAQYREEELQATEEEHAGAINVFFETSNLRHDGLEYPLFRGDNWVY